MRCKDCKHWGSIDWDEEDFIKPWESYTEKNYDFKVKRCSNPKLLFYERPTEINGFAVTDGECYMVQLHTAEDFGCVLFEQE
jgi:hypothetical protein